MRYGIGYKGSKSKIAKDIIDILPSGERFIDLFGGGGAVSHCASLSGKYKEVIYNDVNTSIYNLVKDVFTGSLTNNPDIFEWISRERFKLGKEIKPIIKWCWSFGNNGLDYMYSKDLEPQKEAIHKAIVNKEYTDLFLEITKGVIPFNETDDLNIRKKEWSLYHKNILKEPNKYRIQNLEVLLPFYSFLPLKNIEFTNNTYLSYNYKEGDIVYCDPPYNNTNCGSYSGFNSDVFINWARQIPCYISEYNMPEDFECIWKKSIQVTVNRINTPSIKSVEKLFKSPCLTKS
jgi:16S rRNA G966 N2-methylase RsmD